MGHLNTTSRLVLHALLLLVLAVPVVGALGLPAIGAHVDVDTIVRVEVAATVELPPLVTPLEASALAPISALTQISAAQGFAPGGLGLVPDAPDPNALGAGPAAVQPPGAAVSAAAGMTLLWIVLERLGTAQFFAALYSRLAPSRLLEHERRERVIALVRERPGIGPQDVATALGTGWGVTIYHLNKMERAGLITSQRAGHHRCYFAAGVVGREEQKTAGMFRVLSTRRIAELIAAKPGLTQTQIGNELGLSASALSKQVARLEAAALLRREASAGAQRLYPQPALTGALA